MITFVEEIRCVKNRSTVEKKNALPPVAVGTIGVRIVRGTVVDT